MKNAASVNKPANFIHQRSVSFIRGNGKTIAQFVLTALFLGLAIWFLKHEKPNYVKSKRRSIHRIYYLYYWVFWLLSYAVQNLKQNNQIQGEHSSAYSENLPLTILHSEKRDSLPLAFVISGDGGWNNFEQSFSEKLVENGISVVGLDAQKYFRNKKTPEQTTQDNYKGIADVIIKGIYNK